MDGGAQAHTDVLVAFFWEGIPTLPWQRYRQARAQGQLQSTKNKKAANPED